jgi:polysaccharide export outer membrane protein
MRTWDYFWHCMPEQISVTESRNEAAPLRIVASWRAIEGGFDMRTLFIAGIVAGLLGGCAGPEDLLALEQDNPPLEGYHLDTGDQLRVTVFNEQQLTGDYLVGANGTISMPLIGEVSVRGQTTGELEQTLANRLSVEKHLLIDPSISVQVQAYRPFFILGEVRNPGQYPCPYETTVLSAVAIAGGFSYRARTDYVSITRKIGPQLVERRADRTSIIQPGDVIYVYERYF